VHARTPGFEATWFAAAEDNLSFGYPWVDTTRMLASMGVTGLRGLDVPRKAGVARAEKDLAADPEDTDFWGVPYVSQLHGELVLSHGSAVIVDGLYRGEVSLDFRLDTLQRLALRWQAEDSQVWIVERGLVVLADASEALRVPPATLTAHLNVLRAAKLVLDRREGRSIVVRANFARMNDLVAYLTENCCAGATSCGPGVICPPAPRSAP
jgi:DNA-binding transcriptional ArsR family regulator